MKGYQVMMFLVMVALSLALPPAVQATCAWVFWSKDSIRAISGKYHGEWMKKDQDWQFVRVHATKAACEAQGESMLRFMRNEQWKHVLGTVQQGNGGESGIIINTNEHYRFMYEFVCTPDTVDPRARPPR